MQNPAIHMVSIGMDKRNDSRNLWLVSIVLPKNATNSATDCVGLAVVMIAQNEFGFLIIPSYQAIRVSSLDWPGGWRSVGYCRRRTYIVLLWRCWRAPIILGQT